MVKNRINCTWHSSLDEVLDYNLKYRLTNLYYLKTSRSNIMCQKYECLVDL